MIIDDLLIPLKNVKYQFKNMLTNIVGLIIGITSCILLMIYILDEVSYDRFHEKSERIYRVVQDLSEGDRNIRAAPTSAGLGINLSIDRTEVSNFVTIAEYGDFGVEKKEGQKIPEEEVYLSSSTFFEVFSFELLKGDIKSALSEPFTIVLNQTLAKKYFANEDPIGKTLRNKEGTFVVTGVMKDIDENSHIEPRALVSLTTRDSDIYNQWGDYVYYNYVLLEKGVVFDEFEESINSDNTKYFPIWITERGGGAKMIFQKLTDIHLYSDYIFDLAILGDAKNVTSLGAIAFTLFLLVFINYANLSTATTMKRYKEVGIRKVSGASRPQLVFQYLTEFVVVTLLSGIVSIILVLALLPLYSEFLNKEFTYLNIINPEMIFGITSILVFMGLISGSYPAFFLANFPIINVLKGGDITSGNKGIGFFKKSVIVVQLVTSIALFIITWITYEQINFAKGKSMGFNSENIIEIVVDKRQRHDLVGLKNTLLQNPHVLEVGRSSFALSDNISTGPFGFETPDGFQKQIVSASAIDDGFIPVFELEIITGRNFLPMRAEPYGTAAIINESLAKKINYKDDYRSIIGQSVELPVKAPNAKIVGIVKDFHVKSMHEPISPTILVNWDAKSHLLYVKYRADNFTDLITSTEKAYRQFFGELPFNYTFVDDDLNNQYDMDEKSAEFVLGATIVSIFIACLGLVGVLVFSLEQRVKEIGIRKVSGASINDIILLFFNEYRVLIIISFLTAYPIAYLYSNNWLDNFQYRIEIDFIPFLMASIAILLITVGIIGYFTRKYFNINPAEVLKNS